MGWLKECEKAVPHVLATEAIDPALAYGPL
jgi:hypothetical protein